MYKNIKLHIAAALIALVGVVAIFTFFSQRTTAATLAYTIPHVATSSSMQIGPQLTKNLMASSSACVARTISTGASAIVLSFDGVVRPSGMIGHLQAASTTVTYDNGAYGCDAIWAYGYASSTISITEMQ